MNRALISGLDVPIGIAVSGESLYVTNLFGGFGTIGKYTTSGATVNAALVSGLPAPQAIAVSGGNLFVGQLWRVSRSERHDWRIHNLGGDREPRAVLRA